MNESPDPGNLQLFFLSKEAHLQGAVFLRGKYRGVTSPVSPLSALTDISRHA
jgi:hypothetical protein